MASNEVVAIQSRLGEREVRLDKVILFPCGIIGFEDAREFTLLQIQENSPLLVLQSMEEPSLGLLVADPFAFVPEYSLDVSDAEQHMLQARDVQELAVLVTATIPPGRPEETVLNLLGPIVVNHRARIGLQIPQTGKNILPARRLMPEKDSRA
ncbi:MAG: flagellar assembly protein FliW [Desulfovibrio sp.]|jgi:flagellar assembly factor FliW|nr:flagellar assembly protein FliW [Desulfovibrio sp.]